MQPGVAPDRAPGWPLTGFLLIANIVVAGLLALAGPSVADLATIRGGLIPLRLSLALDGAAPLLPALASLFTNMFLHGGLLHLGLDMLMLLAMGRLLEPLYGGGRLLVLYLGGGLAAALAEWALAPMSPVPVVGASGAVSALIGAQALLAGRVQAAQSGERRNPLVQALGLAIAWTLVQWLAGVVMAGEGIHLAVAGHVGGFVAGLALGWPLLAGRLRN